MAADWTMKKNDLLPIWSVTLQDADGAVDLTGVSSVTLKMVLRDDMGATPKIDAAGVPDPDQVTNKGKMTYTWVNGDTDTPGIYNAEVEALFGTDPLTFPNDSFYTILILDDVDENV